MVAGVHDILGKCFGLLSLQKRQCIDAFSRIYQLSQLYFGENFPSRRNFQLEEEVHHKWQEAVGLDR